jgi:hypothetical protein
MCGGCRQWGDVAARQPGFTIFNKRVAFRETGLSRAQAFNLPAFKAQPRLEVIFDGVVVPCFAVFRNAGIAFAGFFAG